MSLSTHALREESGLKQDQMKAIMGKPALDDNDRKTFDDLETEVRNLNADSRRMELVEKAERLEQAEPLKGRGSDLSDLQRRFNVGKAISEHVNGQLTGVEREYHDERRSGRKDSLSIPVSAVLGERRALTKTTPAGGPGSNLVQTSLGPYIDALRPVLAV